MTASVEVFDPAMCCSTGVCGPSVDSVLVRFAADLDALATAGVAVSRASLSQEPARFVATPAVAALLAERGEQALPVVVVDGQVRCAGRYPSRDELASWTASTPAMPAVSMLPLAESVSPADEAGCCGGSGCC